MPTRSVLAVIFSLLALVAVPAFAVEEDLAVNAPVPIIEVVDDSTFPQFWRRAPINANATTLGEAELIRSAKVIEKGLQKYPESFVQYNLNMVHAVRDLQFYGVRVAGTNGARVIYLANRGKSLGYTDEAIERTLHAEFSSVLLRARRTALDEAAWKKINFSNFRYGNSYNAIRTKQASILFNKQLFSSGFLYDYARSSFENDFNSIAAQLFMGRNDFWKAVDSNKRLAQKTGLAIQFYQTLDPAFTEEYFRGI